MTQLLKKYKAFIIGLLLFRILVFLLSYFEYILIDNTEVLSNTLGFIFGWLILSLPIHYFPVLKKNSATSSRLILLAILFVLLIINDLNSSILGNPITAVGLISVALGFMHTIAPSYFRKYALPLIGFYTLILGYFLYVRLYINDLSLYLNQEKELKIILSLPLALVFANWIYEQWKWVKNLESKKSKAELALLKSQVNPHFFFNTLNNLYGLTVEKSNDAPNIVLKLSDMMRYTIYMGGEDHILLKDEVDYLKNYIELHRIRHRHNVDIRFRHSPDLNHQVSPLLFIIPLENAFKHGVEKMTDGAYIHMDLITEGDSVLFTIENNFCPEEISKETGIGLTNLKQRLKYLYPAKHSIDIQKSNNNYKLSLKINTK